MRSLDRFRDEVLRWNRSFSLVSRQDPEGQTDRLIRECVQGADALGAELADLAPAARILYVDLGTGGGFPGLLWALLLPERLPPDARLQETHLVEPREKRAWFLDRTARALGLEDVSVHAVRWGQGGPLTRRRADLLVVSMKALHLPDSDLLAQAAAMAPGWEGSLLVVRFVTAQDAHSRTFDPALGAPAESSLDPARPHHRFRVLGDEDLHSSLLLSWYPDSAL